MEQLMQWELTGETKALEKNQCSDTFVHHKFHTTRTGTKAGPPR
jgi:hypothetical protein